MSVALFGKLQSKRDFVAPGAPRAFLDVWEPWMQAGLASSRLMLGREWTQRYLTAPIWRFWLGAELCGTTVCGAFMPSLDALGRHHPLVALAAAPAGFTLASPEVDAQEGWHRAVEDFLLDTLDPATSWEAALARAQALPEPVFTPAPEAAADRSLRLDAAMRAAPLAPGAAQSAFAALARADAARTGARLACFWTEGGAGFPALALRAQGLPAPERFDIFLTGRARGGPAALQAG